MAETSASTTDVDLEAARTRIRARLALAFVLDDVDLSGRAARLASIVGATASPTKPLDAAAAQLVAQGAVRVELPAIVEAALGHAGAAREDARRLVRAVAWLEGRTKVHLCDVLVVDALSRTRDVPVRAAIDRALGGANRAEWLATGIERALAAEAERKEHATDAQGQLLYLDTLGRPTAERAERIARITSRGVPLYVPPLGAGFGAAGAAYTDDELWRVHFATLPHGERRLREWTLDPLHRAFDERPRTPIERPAEPEPDVVASRAADLRNVLAYAEAARANLLALPTLAAHEPLFVDRLAADEIAEANRSAIAALGRVIGTIQERTDAFVRGVPGETLASAVAPADDDCEAVPTSAWPLVFSLTGGPLSARIAAVRVLAESLPSGLAPAPTELEWPEPSIREPILFALAGSQVLEVCARTPREIPWAVVEVLEVIAAAQRTQRRAFRALSGLSNARPALVEPSDDDRAAARDEAAALAGELVARSIAETARARLARGQPTKNTWPAADPPSWARAVTLVNRPRLGPREAMALVLDDLGTLAASPDPRVAVVRRLADGLEWQLGKEQHRHVALVVLGNVNLLDTVEVAWLALLRFARANKRSVFTDSRVRESPTDRGTAMLLATGGPSILSVGARPDSPSPPGSAEFLHAVDAWHIRNTDILLVPESVFVAQDLVTAQRPGLRKRDVRIFALAGDLAKAHPIELTSA